MAVMKKSLLDNDGERVARLFQEELVRRGRPDDDWSIMQDGDGVSIRHSASLEDDEPLQISAAELRVLKVPDYTVKDAIRPYLDLLLTPDRT
jgi:hypothetical protein